MATTTAEQSSDSKDMLEQVVNINLDLKVIAPEQPQTLKTLGQSMEMTAKLQLAMLEKLEKLSDK